MTEEVRSPNRLLHEVSPYLQQHAHNPVDWYPWGPEALQKAKDEDKPIFLSIGYSACHWCHVMERESFDNPQTAQILNAHFVNIKVDREERPDLDHIYQTVCQIVTRQGGWPLSVWLTPERKPFHVGTYFPPEDRYGRPGFPRLLRSIARAWEEKREEVLRVAENWTAALQQSEDAAAPAGTEAPERAVIVNGAAEMAARIDRRYGGFGGAPKFPSTSSLDLMLRQYAAGGERSLLDLVLLSLRKMAEGGIYDQIGGGFHRYSVDARWAVPHFEKMLYDNALLVPLYLNGWQCTGDPFFARIARETLAYVQREMTHPDGGFYSTTDADSEGEEGKFFVWTPAQVKEVLGEAEGDLLCRHLGVTAEGNFEHGTTVLHVAASAEQLAQELGQPLPEVERRLAEGKAKLYQARARRVPPFRDEKILTGWNGLMISALAQAARILRAPAYAAAAGRAADFVLTRLQQDGRLLRRFKDGQAGIAGYLEDYAYFTAGLIDLYEATFAPRWLAEALRLARGALDLFWHDESGFYLTPAGGPDLIARPKDAFDSATPAAGSVAVMNGLRLQPYTEDERFRQVAETMFRAYRPHMEKVPGGMASLLAALDLYLAGPTEVTLVAPHGLATAEEWLARLGPRYMPGLVLTVISGAAPALPGGVPEVPPIWAGKAPRGSRLTGYVCRNFACSAPVTEWADLEKLL